MEKEIELMQSMTSYVDGANERIRRMNRRIRNEADETTGEVFDLLNRKLVSPEQIKALSKSLWLLVVSVNKLYNDVEYWHEFNRELASRVKFTDEEED